MKLHVALAVGFLLGCTSATEATPTPGEDVSSAADSSGRVEETWGPDVPDVPTEPEDVPDVSAPDSSSEDTFVPGPLGQVAGPLEVGVGRVRMPVPLGIGTAGFGQINLGGGGEKSRYADNYPASQGIYTHPSFHAVALRTGTTTVALLRVDLVGVSQEARQAVVRRVLELGGPDLQDGLVVAATHTHSGPGRLIDIPLWAAIADTFFPEFYVRMVDAMAQAVVDAVNDLEPATWGSTVLDTDALHNDRRCENPEHTNGSMPILRFDRKSDQKTKALIAMYSVHGTVVDSDAAILTRDFHGAVELKLEEQFDSPVTALFFNSWSGDTSPKTEHVESIIEIPDEYNALEDAGNRAAALIMAAIDGIEMHEDAQLGARVARIPLSLEALGYDPDDENGYNWQWGAVYCGGGIEPACWGEGEPPSKSALTLGCVPFSEDSPAPQDTLVGVLRIGNFVLATLPGEPVTALGERVITELAEGAKATLAADDRVFLIGYAQDYTGYDVPEDDWYHGGYEASGALWGPKQGDYLADHVIQWGLHILTGAPLPWEPMPVRVAKSYTVAEWQTDPTAPANIAKQPAAAVTLGDIVEIVVNAGDPWLLAPEVTLLRKDGDTWTPVLKKSGRPVKSDGYEFDFQLAVDPPYGDKPSPITRTFAWTVRFPTARAVATTTPALTAGQYALRVTGRTDATTEYSLTTEPFVLALP